MILRQAVSTSCLTDPAPFTRIQKNRIERKKQIDPTMQARPTNSMANGICVEQIVASSQACRPIYSIFFFHFFFWLFKLNDENQQRHCGSRKASCSTNPNVVEKVGYVVAHSDSFTSRIQKKSMSRGFSTSEMYSRLERWIKKVNVSDRVLLRSLWCFTSSHFILVTKMRSQFRKKLKMSRDASKSSKNCRLGFEKKLAKNVRFQ